MSPIMLDYMSTSAKPETSEHLEWRERSRNKVYEGRFFDLISSDQESNDGRRGDFILLECADWANTVALTVDEKGRDCLVLVRQYRIGGKAVSLEFPGGMIDEGEDPLAAAKRELLEETGFTADSWEKLGDINPNPSFMTNRTYCYLAQGLTRVSRQELDELESIDVHIVPIDELESGKHPEFLVNGVMVISWYWFTQRYKTKNPQ